MISWCHTKAKPEETSHFVRSELGSDLEIVILEMTAAEQEERIRARHSGSQHAVNLMRAVTEH